MSLKIALYVGGWSSSAASRPGMGGLARHRPVVAARRWRSRRRSCGACCSRCWASAAAAVRSPAATFRRSAASLYFLRPGTTKLPVFAGRAADRRHAAHLARRRAVRGARARRDRARCVAPQLEPRAARRRSPCCCPALGVLDKTIFLCARGEHYWTTIMVLRRWRLGFVPGAKAVQLALWFWAGVSKLNHHFPAVVGVMTSNSPFTRFAGCGALMYRNYPDDLRPSRLAAIMAHAGTLLELAVPDRAARSATAATRDAGRPGADAGAARLHHQQRADGRADRVERDDGLRRLLPVLGARRRERARPIGSPVAALLVVMVRRACRCSATSSRRASRSCSRCATTPATGPYSVWLFRGESYASSTRLTKSVAPGSTTSSARFYDRSTCVGIVGKVMAFRLMHLHGRALAELVPKAVDAASRTTSGSTARSSPGMVLGWNFGDGHLHDEQLLARGPGAVRLRGGRAALHHGRGAAARAHDAALPHPRREDRPARARARRR